MSATKRIIKNSLMMYAIMFLTIIIGIYTSRVILATLGVEDFGIYFLIGGLVILFTFVNDGMSGAVQRFLSAALGKNDFQETKELFNASIILHIAIALIVLIAGETLGTWFLQNKLTIPPLRIDAACGVFQAVLIAFIFQILSAPARAMLISYEYMGAVSLVTFLNPLGRLISIIIASVLPYDKLVSFSVMIPIFSLIQLILFYLLAIIRCETCRFVLVRDKSKYRALTSFAGWDLFGNLVVVGKEQGTPIILNMFFGVTINAATGVAQQLSSNIVNLSRKVLSAANPQIVKSYVGGDKERVFSLVNQLSKLGFTVVFIISVPLFIETEFLLKLWLVTPPEYAIVFVRLALFVKLVDTISKPLLNLTLATGHIKLYHTTVSMSNLIYLPILYGILKEGFSAESSYILAAILSVFAQLIRLAIVRKLTGFSISHYVKEVIVKQTLLVLVSIIIVKLLLLVVSSILINIFVIPLIILIIAYIIILDRSHKQLITLKLKKFMK